MTFDSQTADISSARRVVLKVEPGLIGDVHSLVEECDYIAIVRTLDPDLGIVELIATRDTIGDAERIAFWLAERLGGTILHPKRPGV